MCYQRPLAQRRWWAENRKKKLTSNSESKQWLHHVSLRTHVCYILGTERHGGKFFITTFIYTEWPSAHIGMRVPYPYIDDCTVCQHVHKNLSSFLCWIVKQSHYRTGQAQRIPAGWGSQISRQAAYVGGKIVSPTHWPPLPSRKYSWYSFLWVNPRAMVRPEGLCQWKIPLTPSEIELATFRLMAQCLNELHHRVPPLRSIKHINPINQ